jgi:carbon-monoxide dehydrogenase medium subunit
MYEFNYHRPGNLEEASALLAECEDAQVLAGGMTLLPAMKMRLAAPSDLVDLGAIEELGGIHDDGGRIVIGAMTLHADVAASDIVRRRIPALAHLAGQIGDAQVRNRGTVGGSVANSDPAADYPAAVVGLGATVLTNHREIASDDFFVHMFETALEPGEILKSISFPVPRRAGYCKFANPASRYAIVGVMVADTGEGVRVGVTGAGTHAFRATGMEQALSADFSAAALRGVEIDDSQFNEDLHASAAYRGHLLRTMAGRAVTAAGA